MRRGTGIDVSRVATPSSCRKVWEMIARWIATGSVLGALLAGCATMPGGSASPSTSSRPGTQTEQAFAATLSREVRLKYLLYLPKDYAVDRAGKFPLVLFLHGAGERGTNLMKVAIHGPPKQAAAGRDFPFILVSPQCPEGQIWDDEGLSKLIETLKSSLRVDPTRIHITGLSMGGSGTWALISKRPELFASAAPICGRGDRARTLPLPPAQQEAFKTLPVWVFHGGKDTSVPLSESERMVDQFKRAGATDVQLTVYPEAGHDSWTQTYNNPEFYDWLLSKHR